LPSHQLSFVTSIGTTTTTIPLILLEIDNEAAVLLLHFCPHFQTHGLESSSSSSGSSSSSSSRVRRRRNNSGGGGGGGGGGGDRRVGDAYKRENELHNTLT